MEKRVEPIKGNAGRTGISEKYIGTTLKTAWAFLHKIRSFMGERESTYKLGGSIEMDEAFFGGKAKDKRGRGSEKKVLLASVWSPYRTVAVLWI